MAIKREKLKHIAIWVCARCLAGVAGTCHDPGCHFCYLNIADVPTFPEGSYDDVSGYTPKPAVPGDGEQFTDLLMRFWQMGANNIAFTDDDLLQAMHLFAAQAAAAQERAENQARIDENESLMSVAEHEIELPDHCDMHEKYTAYCHACKKRKWYGEISKDWKRVIDVRLAELKAAQPKEQQRGGEKQ